MENINFEWQINKCSFIEPIFNNKEFGIYNYASFYLLEAIIILDMSKQKEILDKKLVTNNDDNKLMLRSSLSDAMVLKQLILDFKLYVKDIKKIEDNSKNSLDDEKILKILSKLMELGVLNELEDSSKLKNTILELFDVNKREDFKEIVEYAINNRFQDEKSFNNLKKCILNQLNYKYNIKYKFLTNINAILDIYDCYNDDEYLNGSQNDNINNFLNFIRK